MHYVDVMLIAQLGDACERPQVVFAEIQALNRMVRGFEQGLDLVRRSEKVRVDLHSIRIEPGQEVHEQPTTAMQAPVVTDVIDEPKDVDRAMGHASSKSLFFDGADAPPARCLRYTAAGMRDRAPLPVMSRRRSSRRWSAILASKLRTIIDDAPT
jgi:hypothetical protein